MFEYVNYYGMEKYFSCGDCEFYFIPYEYKVGTYKINEIDYIKCDSKDFKKFADDKKRKILKENMLWLYYGKNSYYVTNGFSCISVNSMDMLEFTYKRVSNKNKDMLFEIVNINNRDDFYRYVDKSSYKEVVGECVENVYEEIMERLKEENKEMSKLFLDFFGDYEAPIINLTIVSNEDVLKLKEKFSYKNYVDKRYKGLKLFKRFVSYKEDYEKYISEIISNSGDYDDCCVYELKNVDKVFSYYASLFEYDYFENDGVCSQFLMDVCCKAREMVLEKISEFNIEDDFVFYDVTEWD